MQKEVNPANQTTNSPDSPLLPKKGGYPIVLYNGKEPKSGVSLDDLEDEPISLVQKTPQGTRIRIIPAKNPYMMKGAIEYLNRSNAALEAENEHIADGLVSQWQGSLKEPLEPYAPLLRENARESTEDEQAEALMAAKICQMSDLHI